MNVVDRLLSTGEIKVTDVGIENSTAVYLYRGDEPGSEPKFNPKRKHSLTVNTADKRMWIYNEYGRPIEVELAIKDDRL